MTRKRIFTLLSSIIVPVILGGIILFALGYDPVEAYIALLRGAFVGKLNIGTTLVRFGPILFLGLAFALTIKANYFNLGAEGAFYIGALAAAGVGQIVGLPKIIHIPFTLLSGIFFGAIWQAIPGFLRAVHNVNEVVSNIMMNFVAMLLSEFFILDVWEETKTASGRSVTIQESAQFTSLLRPSQVSTGIFLVIVAFIFVYWLVHKTRFGFKLRSIGFNPFFASYIGFDVKKTVIIATAISGAIAGMAGSIETMGTYTSMYLGFSAGTAFDGLLASLIAGNDLRFLPLTAFMIAAFKAGSAGMERTTGIPKSLIDMFVPILIFLLSMRDLYDISSVWDRLTGKFSRKSPKKPIKTEE